MKIIYMGTPEIAVPALESIIEAGHEVVAAVTQPDRAKGRHKELVACPVKACALAHDIPVLQPEKARDDEFVEELKKYEPDLIVVMAYGQILKKNLLELPPLGCINIHASLLPKYRGASPISASILYGENETGVTTMYMDEGLDTGDMLLTKKLAIDAKDNTETLSAKVASLGGEAIVETIEKLEAGTLKRTPQTGESSYVGMLKKEEGEIAWSDSAVNLDRRVRAFYPWPGTFTTFKGTKIKIFDVDIIDDSGDAEAGTILEANKNTLIVKCGEQALKINDLQAEGKKRMSAGDFLRGFKLEAGEKLGD